MEVHLLKLTTLRRGSSGRSPWRPSLEKSPDTRRVGAIHTIRKLADVSTPPVVSGKRAATERKGLAG